MESSDIVLDVPGKSANIDCTVELSYSRQSGNREHLLAMPAIKGCIPAVFDLAIANLLSTFSAAWTSTTTVD